MSTRAIDTTAGDEMSTASVAGEGETQGTTRSSRPQPHGAPPWPRWCAVWLIGVGNAAIIVWLWMRGGGVSGVQTVGDLWTSVGRVTGLFSAYLALLQVLLLARLPWLALLSGFNRLTV